MRKRIEKGWILVVWVMLILPWWNIRAASESGAEGEASYSVAVWETDRGLPQNSVIALTQARDGYLWLGTLNGLVRFDGMKFTVLDENNSPGLPSSRIVYLFEDSRGRLWVGTETAGTVVLEGGEFTSPSELSLGGVERRLVAASEDKGTGAVWLYHANGELWRYLDGKFSPFLLTPNEISQRRHLMAEASGGIWIGSDQRLCLMGDITVEGALEIPVQQEMLISRLDYLLSSRGGGHWRLANGKVQKWERGRLARDLGDYPWNFETVSSACEDAEGNLVVGTLGAGLYWFDGEGRVTSVSTNQGLSNNYILALETDREGNLWVGTDGGGLNRIRQQDFKVLEGTWGMVVQSVVEDAGGGVWLGANSGGVAHWRPETWETFMDSLSIRSVLQDSKGRLWAGSRGFGLWRKGDEQWERVRTDSALHPVVQVLHEDVQGRLWVGTQGGLGLWDGQTLKVFSTQDGMSSDSVTALADGEDGALWVGTEGGGLNLWRENEWTVYRSEAEGLPSDQVTSLWLDEDGVLWVGTSRGLARFFKGEWSRYTMRDGLISNSIGYLLEDDRGHLWMGSNAGLMRVAKQALNDKAGGSQNSVFVRSYGKKDGLPTAECSGGSQPGAARTVDGRLWFPTIKGLVHIDPARLSFNTNPPPVRIESVLVEGRELEGDLPGEITMSPEQIRLEIHYTSLNLGAAELARFRYRLAGHEGGWTDAGGIRVARYSKLPPGRYEFEVMARNEDGIWSQDRGVLGVVVLPPFWRTWWFITIMAVLLTGMIIAMSYYISTQKLQRELAGLKEQEAVEKERARIARDIHDQLGANLTQVALLGELVESDKDEPEEVEAHARQISQTARDTTRTLDEIVWTVNPSNDTLEGVINYICKYAQEYLAVAGIRYRLEVPSDLPHIDVPPEVRHHVFLAAKEAVTNVVRHAKAGSAWIRLQVDDRGYSLEIADDGCGLAGMDEARAATRNGLKNMRTRMESIGGNCFMGAAPEGGLLVRLTVPRNKP